MSQTFAEYHVGLKILLNKEGEYLFLRTADHNLFDLPGGRIDETENKASLEKILDREIKEELGDTFEYSLGESLFNFRIFKQEQMFKVFISVYGAEYIRGDIRLSHEHKSFEWINPKKYTFLEKDFFSNEMYTAFIKHFKQKV